MGRSKRRIHVEPQRRRKPDYRKISAALQAYVVAQAEADAEADSGTHTTQPPRERRQRRERP